MAAAFLLRSSTASRVAPPAFPPFAPASGLVAFVGLRRELPNRSKSLLAFREKKAGAAVVGASWRRCQIEG